MTSPSVSRSVDVLLPWHIDLPAISPSDLATGFTTIGYTAALYASYRQSSGAQNDEVAWDLVLAAGTWTFTLAHWASSDRGIYTVSIDGTDKGTIDGYAAGSTASQLASITGIAVPLTGKQRLKLKMATKNASSSSYYGLPHGFHLRRTA